MSESITRLAVRRTNVRNGASVILTPDEDGEIAIVGQYVGHQDRAAIEDAISSTLGASSPLYRYELLVGTLEPVEVKPPVPPLPTESGYYIAARHPASGNHRVLVRANGRWYGLGWSSGVESMSEDAVREWAGPGGLVRLVKSGN